MMFKRLWLLVWLLLLPVAAGCTHAQAKTTPEMPPLEMPAPPPREVQPVESKRLSRSHWQSSPLTRHRRGLVLPLRHLALKLPKPRRRNPSRRPSSR